MRMSGTGLNISKIQRFSVDDGPGIRTTVFLKGCNLRCAWCHNPENLSVEPQLQFAENLCTFCGKCAEVCPGGVHTITVGRHTLDRQTCMRCGECEKSCLNKALELIGQTESFESILDAVMRDKDFYQTSGGGVTFSGGEPMLQYQNLKVILKMCREEGIHTAVDTAGNVPFEAFEEVMPYIDVFLYDLKAYSEQIHKQYTGVFNRVILDNAVRLSDAGAKLIIRTPLIRGVNTDKDEMKSLASFASNLKGLELYQLLPYHDYGENKYNALGEIAQEFDSPDDNELQDIVEIFSDYDIHVRIR